MRRNDKQRSISLKECYAILDLPPNAGIEEVKHSYRKRAFELHPDLNPNDPNASKKFQLLNEAYVALSAVLKAEEAKEKKSSETTSSREKTSNRDDARARQQDADKARAEKEAKASSAKEAEQKKREQADKAYAEQDVLRDLLNDPFARRVFEDIYSELNRQQAEKAEQKAKAGPEPEPEAEAKPEPPKKETHKLVKEKAKPIPKPSQVIDPAKEHKGKGVSGLVRNWFQRQIDEEQTLYLPVWQLVAGRKVRLQISHGLSNEVQQFEVTLPKDFAIGKPIRLKGLGKRVGPWQGDLYLTLLKKA